MTPSLIGSSAVSTARESVVVCVVVGAVVRTMASTRTAFTKAARRWAIIPEGKLSKVSSIVGIVRYSISWALWSHQAFVALPASSEMRARISGMWMTMGTYATLLMGCSISIMDAPESSWESLPTLAFIYQLIGCSACVFLSGYTAAVFTSILPLLEGLHDDTESLEALRAWHSLEASKLQVFLVVGCYQLIFQAMLRVILLTSAHWATLMPWSVLAVFLLFFAMLFPIIGWSSEAWTRLDLISSAHLRILRNDEQVKDAIEHRDSLLRQGLLPNIDHGHERTPGDGPRQDTTRSAAAASKHEDGEGCRSRVDETAPQSFDDLFGLGSAAPLLAIHEDGGTVVNALQKEGFASSVELRAFLHQLLPHNNKNSSERLRVAVDILRSLNVSARTSLLLGQALLQSSLAGESADTTPQPKAAAPKQRRAHFGLNSHACPVHPEDEL